MSTIETTCSTHYRPRTTGLALVAAAFRWLEAAVATYRQRRALMMLSDASLKDIGLSRADAEREGTRHWWDVR